MSDDRQQARTTRVRFTVLSALVLAAAFARLIPHPANFTPVGAMALFGGAHFRSRWAAIGAPLAAMLVSDTVFAVAYGWEFGPMTAVIYACIAAASWIGIRIQGDVRALSVARGSLASALLFFAVTNFAVWAGGTMYAPDLSGLMACYVAAVPFFGGTLGGHVVYGIVLFGGFELLQRRFEVLSVAPARA